MRNKRLVRLTESDLHSIVKESVNRVINEIGDTPYGRYMLGRAAKRASKLYPDRKVYYDLGERGYNKDMGDYYPEFKQGLEDQGNFMDAIDNDDEPDYYRDNIRKNAETHRYNSFPEYRKKVDDEQRHAKRNKYKF